MNRITLVGAALFAAAAAGAPQARNRAQLDGVRQATHVRLQEQDFAEPRRLPPVAWNPAGPAHSLYRLARAALSDNDYPRAARLFDELVGTYPRSEYAADALYWRAWALYRNGTKGGAKGNLETALASLDRQEKEYPNATTRRDARDLRERIHAAQAERGDAQAAARIRVTAGELDSAKGCPSEDDDMRLAALQGLMQMDAESALPILKQVLARREPCTVALRKQAVFLVSQKRGDESANMLLDVAAHDPSSDVRGEAIQWLGQARSDRAVAALDSILVSSGDAEIRNKAIFALSQQRDPRASQSLRRFAEDEKMPGELRGQAVFWLGQGHQGADDAQFLRTLFGKTTNEQLREQIIQAISQSRGGDGEKWLLDIVRDKSVAVEARKNAAFWAGQMHSGDVQQLLALYDEMRGQEELQNQLLFVYSQRREPAATDKLMQIASKDPDRELRKQAIFWLGQKKDPRITQFLLDLINR